MQRFTLSGWLVLHGTPDVARAYQISKHSISTEQSAEADSTYNRIVLHHTRRVCLKSERRHRESIHLHARA